MNVRKREKLRFDALRDTTTASVSKVRSTFSERVHEKTTAVLN